MGLKINNGESNPFALRCHQTWEVYSSENRGVPVAMFDCWRVKENTMQECRKGNYFASSDPHHGIQFIPSDILSGKSSGMLFGILFEILSGILSGITSDILSGISMWHSIWHIF